MKKIGIFLRDYKSASGNKLCAFRSDLLEYIRKYNVEIISIPIDFRNNEYEELEKIIATINTCQGIILPGGAYVHDIDLHLVKYLHEKNIPTLGLCLGMQIMALAFNGDIEILKNNNHQSKEDYVHEIKIKANSKLENIIKEQNIFVNSRHDEHITTTDLQIAAIAPDLTIEAVEDYEKKFFIGVQWHPESLKNDIYAKRIFDAFIKSL